MNEADTRANLIDPQLKEAGWGVVTGSLIRREYKISAGEIKPGGRREGSLSADYVLVHKNRILAAIEAKSDEKNVREGVAQAKNYAQKLRLPTAFAANGREIYQICHTTRTEGLCDAFPSPNELWNKTFAQQNKWQDKFDAIPLAEDPDPNKESRYYQELAIQNVMDAIAKGQSRILLTLATGTGKTFIAAQIAWKLFKSRWTLQKDQKRQPRILFLTDRNGLAKQAYNAFTIFPDDALVRITPHAIRKRGAVPKNASLFFTIFQTFTSGQKEKPYFGDYEPDFFDFIIIDECHRGGANSESSWRDILEHFAPAVQLGLTATPKRDDNVDTYAYFGKPVFTYSLKEGIQDGYLTPFRVKRIQTSLDEYNYEHDDKVLQGEVDHHHTYTEQEFSREIIEIEERERLRTRIMLANINKDEKAIVFCATQHHAALIRDLANQEAKRSDNYCVRVTSADGIIGDNHLEIFKDNERTIPTIATTSRKLSTGVDVLNLRYIVLMRAVNSMIEFKQIIGRGTRIFEGKDYFTIIDFVGASKNFYDPQWDGETKDEDIEEIDSRTEGNKKKARPQKPPLKSETSRPRAEKIKIELTGDRITDIEIISSSLFMVKGELMKGEDLRKFLFEALQLSDDFKTEQELRSLWANPKTRIVLLNKLETKGLSKHDFVELQKFLDAEDSDLLDVLEYILYASPPMSRIERVRAAEDNIYAPLEQEQCEFIRFALDNYIKDGVDELDDSKLSKVLESKYGALSSAKEKLGNAETVRKTFIAFQKHLYLQDAA